MKKTFVIICLAIVLLFSACDGTQSNEDSFDYDISELFVDIVFWSPPSVGEGNNPDKEPEFSMVIEGEVFSGAENFNCVVIEQNHKNLCTYPYLYLLEKKNESGEWELMGYTPEFFDRNFGYIHVADFFDTSSATSAKNTLTIYAKHHGIDGFSAGEYRVTRKVACRVNGESVCETLTAEFTVK